MCNSIYSNFHCYSNHNNNEQPWKFPGLGVTVREFWDLFFECALRLPTELFTVYPLPDNQSESDAKLGLEKLRKYLLNHGYELPLLHARGLFAEMENLQEPESEPEFVQPEEESEDSVVEPS